MNKSLILNKIAEYKNFNKDKEFADFLGISAQNLSKWKARGTYDVELLYTKCPELNPEWLLTGKGEMLKSELSREKKISSNKLPSYEAKLNNEGIPMLPVIAQGGLGYDIEGINLDELEERYIIPGYDKKKADFMVSIQGESMSPMINEGDVLLCKIIRSQLDFQWNKVYIVDSQEYGLIVKRVVKGKKANEIIYRSENPDFDDLIADFSEDYNDARSMSAVLGTINTKWL